MTLHKYLSVKFLVLRAAMVGLGLVNFSHLLFAASDASSVSHATPPAKHTKIGYTLSTDHWIYGATFADMDGAKKTRGSNWESLNYVRNDFIIGNTGWRVRLAPAFYLRTQPRKYNALNYSYLEAADPYIGILNFDVLTARGGDLGVYFDARYHLPLSRRTKNNIGSETDRGGGHTWFRPIVENYFFDQRLIIRQDWTWRHFFSSRPTEETYTDDFWLYNVIQVKASKHLAPYVSYNGYPERRMNGQWTQWSKTHTLEMGLEWNLNDKVMIQPFLETPFLLKNTMFNIYARLIYL